MSIVTADIINGTTTAKSKKIKSLVVTDYLELQGTLLNNANESVKDNVNCRVIKTAATSSPDATITALPTWVGGVDVSASFNTTTGVWTCPCDGIWTITASIVFASGTGTVRGIIIGGTAVQFNILGQGPSNTISTIVGGPGATNTVTSVTWAGTFFIDSGRTLTISSLQTSGGAINVTGANFSAHLVYMR